MGRVGTAGFSCQGEGSSGCRHSSRAGRWRQGKEGETPRWPRTQAHSSRASTRSLHPELLHGHPEPELGASNSWHSHAKHCAQASEQALSHAPRSKAAEVQQYLGRWDGVAAPMCGGPPPTLSAATSWWVMAVWEMPGWEQSRQNLTKPSNWGAFFCHFKRFISTSLGIYNALNTTLNDS